MLVFEERGKPEYPEKKTLGAKERTNNKLNPHLVSMPGYEPRPHWWERQALSPLRHPLLPSTTLSKAIFLSTNVGLFAYLNMLICLFLFGNIQHPDHVRDDNYYVWTFCRLISVRSLFWSNLKLLKGRQTPVTFRSMETWLVNLIIFEIFIFVWQTYSSKPLVSHCDGMKRYSCRSDNSESNCWWKTGWLNRCHHCVHNWCSFTHTGCMAQVSFWLTRISNAHWKETLTFSFRSRLRFYSRYMYLLKSLQCTLFLNIS